MKLIRFTYTNHRGETARRTVRPLKILFGVSDYHDGEHWFLRGWDLDRDDARNFLLAGMTDIEEVE